MKKTLTLLISLFFLSISAQNYEIKGRLIDNSTKEVIPLATIFLDSAYIGNTEIDGSFNIQSSLGEHSLKFSAIGYRDWIKKVSVQKNMSLQPKMDVEVENLNQIVISASRIEQKISDVTVSMDVIQPDLIANNNTTSLDKFIEQSSGVSIINGQANIRGGGGFSYGAGSRVLVLIDDVPVIRPGVGDVLWDYLPTEDIAQVEILKGASSALYGASALNGVINIRTSTATDKPVTKIRLFNGWYDDPQGNNLDWYPDATSHPGYQGFSFYHLRRIKTHDFAFSGNALSDQGFIEGGDRQKVRLSFRSKFRPEKYQNLNFGLNGNAQYSDAGQSLLWNDDTSGFYKPLGDRRGRLSYNQYSIDPFLNYKTQNGKITYHGKVFLVDSAALVYNEIQYQHRINFGKKFFTYLTGGFVNSYSDVEIKELGKHRSNEVAGYFQSDFDLNRLKLSFGIRHQTYALDTSEIQDATVLRAGMNYRIRKGTNIRTSYGQGFRNPSMAEKFIRFSAEPLEIYPNQSLNPERGESAEIGVKQAYKIKKLDGSVDVAAFWSQYRDMMEFSFGLWGDPFQDTFFGLGFKSVNAKLARIRGVEITNNLNGIIGKVGFNLNLGYTYIYPEDRSIDLTDSLYEAKDEYLKYRMSHIGKLSTQAKYKKWSSGLNVRFYSFMENIDPIFEAENPLSPSGEDIIPGLKRYRDENKDGDWVWDFNLGYSVNKHSTFQFIVKNIVNNAYTIRPALPETPRTFVVQYSGQF